LPFKILSGGDEKVIRLFEAPFGFAKAFNDLNSAARNDMNQSITFRTDMANDEIEEQLA